MKLAKPLSHTDQTVHSSERETYLAHCENISRIIAGSTGLKIIDLQKFVDLYLTSVNTETES